MSNRCLRPWAAIVGLVCLGIPALAQTNEIVRGELKGEGLLLNEYRLELTGVDSRSDTFRADVHSDGSFQLRDVPPGSYILQVTGRNGEVVHRELVTVIPQSGLLTVRIPSQLKPEAPPGTISMRQLQHPPSRKAFQAAVAAQRYSEAGKPQKAVEELEKAIKISPDFADAHNNLAVQFMRLGQYEAACEEFEKALEIGGTNVKVLSNLAMAQRTLGRLQDAMASARTALKLDNSAATAHLVVGSILALQPRTRAEGIAHLERAALTLESARQALEKARQLQASAK